MSISGQNGFAIGSDHASNEFRTLRYTSAMTLSIKDPDASALARQLAQETGESLTTAVAQALRERLARLRSRRGRRSAAERVLRVAWALPRLDSRAPDQILGYNEHGVPN